MLTLFDEQVGRFYFFLNGNEVLPKTFHQFSGGVDASKNRSVLVTFPLQSDDESLLLQRLQNLNSRVVRQSKRSRDLVVGVCVLVGGDE